jgi:hypothetical protein
MSRVIGRPAVGKFVTSIGHNGAARPEAPSAAIQWSRGEKRVAAICRGRDCELSITVGGERVLAGTWEGRLVVDGQSVEPLGPWQETCRVRRRRVRYLELSLPLAGGRHVERHLLIAPRDGFVLLADAIVGGPPAALEYTSRLPLAPGARLALADETQEGWLDTNRRRATVLPIGLPEWRGDWRTGRLRRVEGAVELSHSIHGQGLFVPLWIDLKRKRIGKPLTWRRLTVAEERQILPPDRAVGYRIQVGRKQWIIYRSLGPVGNRTVLGKNLCTEFFVARFDHQGQCDAILEIE